MSRSSAVEIDFFSLKTESPPPPPPPPPPPKKIFERRDIQGVISKINPELLKTAMASASVSTSASASASGNKSSSSVASKSCSVPASPVNNQATSSDLAGTAPLTIFYNGAVCIFDVSRHQAENIIKLVGGGATSCSKLAEAECLMPPPTPFQTQTQTRTRLANQDLPMSRKKSLRRFLEKRKQRQNLVSPYPASSPANDSNFR